MQKRIPTTIIEKKNIVKFVLFVVFFALAFIIIFEPFNSDKFLPISKDRFAAYASIISSIGLGVLVISRIIMYVYCSRQKTILSYNSYIIWMLSEIIIISMFCNLFAWLIGTRENGYFEILHDTVFYTSAILFLPYTMTLLYFELKEKSIDIEKLKTTKNKPYETAEVTSLKDFTEDKNVLIHLTDEKGCLKLSISIDKLFYLEAADNYINVCYINKERMSKFCLRNSLKNIEAMNLDSNLIRCHRSYIINFKKVKVLRKEKEGLFVELDSKEVPDIPISKTYTSKIMDMFSNIPT